MQPEGVIAVKEHLENANLEWLELVLKHVAMGRNSNLPRTRLVHSLDWEAELV